MILNIEFLGFLPVCSVLGLFRILEPCYGDFWGFFFKKKRKLGHIRIFRFFFTVLKFKIIYLFI